jgi:hypothetical protein
MEDPFRPFLTATFNLTPRCVQMYHVRIFCWAKIRESARIFHFFSISSLVAFDPLVFCRVRPCRLPSVKQYSDSRNTTPLDPSFRPSCSDFLVETIKLERPSNRPRPLRNEINVRRTLLFKFNCTQPPKKCFSFVCFFPGGESDNNVTRTPLPECSFVPLSPLRLRNVYSDCQCFGRFTAPLSTLTTSITCWKLMNYR